MLQREGGGNKRGLCSGLARARVQDEEVVIRAVFTSNLQISCCETVLCCEMNTTGIMSVLLKQMDTKAEDHPCGFQVEARCTNGAECRVASAEKLVSFFFIHVVPVRGVAFTVIACERLICGCIRRGDTPLSAERD